MTSLIEIREVACFLYEDTSYFRINNRMANSSENKSSSDGQQEEIGSLRDYFKENIRILSSIGQFSYILKIRADQYDVSLTLQLDGKYQKQTQLFRYLFAFKYRLVSIQSA